MFSTWAKPRPGAGAGGAGAGLWGCLGSLSRLLYHCGVRGWTSQLAELLAYAVPPRALGQALQPILVVSSLNIIAGLLLVRKQVGKHLRHHLDGIAF